MTDLALGLLRHGYLALERDRRRRAGTVSYVSRLLGRRAVVVGDADGARLFYDEDVVRRADAVPPPLGWLLFGRGAVHGLDGAAHRQRKQLFLDRLGPAEVGACARSAADNLRGALAARPGAEMAVFPALVSAYGRAVLAWSGVETTEDRVEELSRELAAIVDGFGLAGAAYPRAWAARLRVDAWGRRAVAEVREGRASPREGTVLRALADSDLDLHTASVELGNVLRPTVAVAWLGTFAVVALDVVPQWRGRLAADEGDRERLSFAQEVRRTAPFVPALAGRVRRDATHGELRLHRGDRIVLDVPGINHDGHRYPDPEVFRPDRFLDVEPGPYDLVPQGGGPLTGHRCPGESMALQLLAETLRVFAGTDFEIVSERAADLTRIPTLPPGGLRISV